jgi:hypothetical protein
MQNPARPGTVAPFSNRAVVARGARLQTAHPWHPAAARNGRRATPGRRLRGGHFWLPLMCKEALKKWVDGQPHT